MTGKDFEDQIWADLEDAVGTAGVVLLRRQAFRARAGHGFQGTQVTGDLLVDSPDDAYYIGIECKTLSSKYRFYFSSNYNPDQIYRQMNYAELSGRDMFVAIEARGDEESRMGWEDNHAFLLPIEALAYFALDDGSKITYEDMETFGYPLGTNGDYDFGGDAVKHARAKKEEFENRLESLEADISDLEDTDD